MSGTVIQAPIGVAERTGGLLGDRLIFDQWSAAAESIQTRHTAFTPASDSYVLSVVVPAWDEVLPRTVSDPVLERARQVAERTINWVGSVLRISGSSLLDRSATWLTPGPVDAGTMSASAAVRFIQATLGVPAVAVTESCGISRRTFYNWEKAEIKQPRLKSEGRLWRLVQVVEDLARELGDELPRWIKMEPRRLQWLSAGKFDELVADLFSERSKAAESTGVGFVSGPSSAVGEDIDIPRLAEKRSPKGNLNFSSYRRGISGGSSSSGQGG